VGLFDFFRRGSKPSTGNGKPVDRKFAGLVKTANDKRAQAYDREEALRGLCAVGTPQAAEALLRRFTFKIQFKPLSAAQRERMFVAEALMGDATQLTDEQRRRLAQLEALAPGDFASVKRQVDVLGEDFDADGFLSQLESEHRVKPEVRRQRSIGFTQ